MAFWDYDEDDDEWSEDYRIGEPRSPSATRSTAIEAFLAAGVEKAEIDPVKHMRLAAIQRCLPLRGGEHVAGGRREPAAIPTFLSTRWSGTRSTRKCSPNGRHGTR